MELAATVLEMDIIEQTFTQAFTSRSHHHFLLLHIYFLQESIILYSPLYFEWKLYYQ